MVILAGGSLFAGHSSLFKVGAFFTYGDVQALFLLAVEVLILLAGRD